jgi:hypothetical protein
VFQHRPEQPLLADTVEKAGSSRLSVPVSAAPESMPPAKSLFFVNHSFLGSSSGRAKIGHRRVFQRYQLEGDIPHLS